jgi:hypothetical protein
MVLRYVLDEHLRGPLWRVIQWHNSLGAALWPKCLHLLQYQRHPAFGVVPTSAARHNDLVPWNPTARLAVPRALSSVRWSMPPRVLRCAIEDLTRWHPNLYTEPHAVAFVAVTGQYSIPPAPFGRRWNKHLPTRLAGMRTLSSVRSARKDTASCFPDIARRIDAVAKRTRGLYPQPVMDLIAEKSAVLTKAQAFSDMGLPEAAGSLWTLAASYEERLAPLLESLGHDLEAAVHRLSAAGCYRRAGDLTRAANLYRGALAGPLLDHTRNETQQLLAECLDELARETLGPSGRPSRRQQPHPS